MKSGAPQLFDNTAIGGMTLANRLVRSATWEGMCDEDGRPTAELGDLYRQLAKGGVGLIVTGFAYVTKDGKPLPGSMGLCSDDFSREMAVLTEAVHAEGGKIAVQLGHAGGQTRAALCGCQPLAPSAIEAPQYKPESPAEMSRNDIDRIRQAFVAAAVRARDWGFDAVQLHAAHGYLFNQFLSPHTNRRDDEYGGSWRQRSRFLLETVAEIRKAVGPDYPLLVKLNGSDNLDDGLCLGEARLIARELEKAGIDAIEVSSGTPASGKHGPLRTGIDSPKAEAYNLLLAKSIKQAVSCPIISVGGVRSYWTARDIIRRRDCDLIALCRPLVREPALLQRWMHPQGSTLSRCISCNGCFKTALKGGISCLVDEQAKTRTEVAV